MLEMAFSFHGRINRLQYFLRSLGFGMAIGVFVVVAAVAAYSGLRQGAGGLMLILLMVLLAIPVIVAMFWISFSLQARRFRDMGWNPLYVIPGWIAFDTLDALVVRLNPALSVLPNAPHVHQSLLGGLVNLVLGGCLLFWPGRAEDDGSQPAATPRPPKAPREPRQAAAARVAAPARVAWDGTPRTTFGRRGI